jgi:GntR family transcriptional repressor for pyruvate dehydrogenase complex
MFTKLKQNRMYEDIVNQVMEALFRGDLQSKDKLPSEKELMAIFGVSRVTVREAMRSLEQLGVIEIRQGSLGGAYIRDIDLDTVIEQVETLLRLTNITFPALAEARALLERMMIRELIPDKIQESHLHELENNVAQAEEFFVNRQSEERLADNFKFHTILAEITGNPIIILMHKIIANLSYHFFKNVNPTPQMVEKTLQYHRDVVEFLKKGQFHEASRICSEHIKQVSQLIMEKSKQQSLLGRHEGDVS